LPITSSIAAAKRPSSASTAKSARRLAELAWQFRKSGYRVHKLKAAC
jgi:hypothetical protein